MNLTPLETLEVIQPINFEDSKTKLIELIKVISPDVELYESSDTMLLVESFLYDIMHRDEALNVRFRNALPIYATGTNLDDACLNWYGTTRLEGEDDKAFLERSLLSLQQSSTAGAEWTYIYHVKTVDARIVDVLPWRNAPGEVSITWYAVVDGNTEEQNIAYAELQNDIVKKLIDKKLKPIGDKVYYVGDQNLHVNRAVQVPFTISATLHMLSGKDGNLAKETALKNINAWLLQLKIGQDIKPSKITSLLHVAGVDEVVMTNPAQALVIDKYSIASCTSVTLTLGGQIDE